LHVKKVLVKRLNIWLLGYDTGRSTATQALSNIRQSSHAKLAQFNHYVTMRSNFPNDPRFGEQWGLHNTGQNGGTPDADIDAPEAWDISTGGNTALGDEIVVAVIDGGFFLNAPDLDFWKNVHEIPGNGIDDDNNGYIDDYDGWNAYLSTGYIPPDPHGTHVTGIACAKGNNSMGTSGVNWNVKIMPIAGSSPIENTWWKPTVMPWRCVKTIIAAVAPLELL
jgi:Subtilase family